MNAPTMAVEKLRSLFANNNLRRFWPDPVIIWIGDEFVQNAWWRGTPARVLDLNTDKWFRCVIGPYDVDFRSADVVLPDKSMARRIDFSFLAGRSVAVVCEEASDNVRIVAKKLSKVVGFMIMSQLRKNRVDTFLSGSGWRKTEPSEVS